jgi:hypothetical protein
MAKVFYLTEFSASQLLRLERFARRDVSAVSPELGAWLADAADEESERRETNAGTSAAPIEPAPLQWQTVLEWKAPALARALRAAVIFAHESPPAEFSRLFNWLLMPVVCAAESQLRAQGKRKRRRPRQ